MTEINEYSVLDGDTLQRVAIKFNTTPGDLARLNKISPFQSVLFSGQKLKIPKPGDSLKINFDSRNKSTSSKVTLRPTHKSHPGTVTRISAPLPSTRAYSVDSDTDDISERQFVKLKGVRVVGENLEKCPGTLLITPKFLVFDSERSSSESEEIITKDEPLYNVGLYILLDTVIGLNTYSSLNEIVQSSQPVSPVIMENNVIVDSSMDDTDKLKLSSDKDDLDNNESKMSKILYLVVKAQPLSDSYVGTDLPLHMIHRQTLNEAQMFIFGVPSDKIEEAYSFLIISGVGGYCDRPAQKSIPILTTDNNLTTNDRISPSSPATSVSYIWSLLFTDYSLNHFKAPANAGQISNDSDLSENRSKIEESISWELVDGANQSSVVADALKEFEEESFMPQLKNGESKILSDSMLHDLSRNLPSHLSDSNFYLVYQTGIHGYSLGTIYRKMARFNCPTLLLIQDCSDTVFGAYMTECFHISTHYYGNGECFVFNWSPDFQKYEWTRENSFFLKGDSNCFSIGSKSGHSAIWFEDTLKYGRSEPTDTFDNPRLSGANCNNETNNIRENKSDDNDDIKTKDTLPPASRVDDNAITSTQMEYNFIIKCLEVWRFNV